MSLSLRPSTEPSSCPSECTACARADQQGSEFTLRRRSSRYSCWSSFRWRMIDVPRPRDGFSESLQQHTASVKECLKSWGKGPL